MRKIVDQAVPYREPLSDKKVGVERIVSKGLSKENQHPKSSDLVITDRENIVHETSIPVETAETRLEDNPVIVGELRMSTNVFS